MSVRVRLRVRGPQKSIHARATYAASRAREACHAGRRYPRGVESSMFDPGTPAAAPKRRANAAAENARGETATAETS